MKVEQLTITDYKDFKNFLQNLRSREYPLERFLTLLMGLPQRIARTHLLRASYEDSPDIVCEVLHLASRLIPMEAVVRSLELLSHPDDAIRIEAIHALRHVEAPCELTLLRLLETEPHGDVRSIAVFVLGVIGTERSLASLKAIAASDTTTDYEGRTVAEKATEAFKMIKVRQRNVS